MKKETEIKTNELTKEDMKDIIKDLVKDKALMPETTGTAYENFDQSPVFSHQQNIHHDRHKFYLDFQNSVLNFDAEHKGNMITNHKIIILDPFVAKSFCEILTSNIARYEAANGKIDTTETMASSIGKDVTLSTKKKEKPSYLG